jgi:hypothetical protein
MGRRGERQRRQRGNEPHAGFSIAVERSLRGKMGRASGVEIEALAATVRTIRAGRVTSARLYQTKEQALKPWGWRSRR